MTLTKKSSYSPPQTIASSPAKPWSNKLKVRSYDAEGRSSSFREAPKINKTWNDVVLRDDKGGRNDG